MQFYARLQATGHRQQVSIVVTVCGLLANGYKDSGASLVAHLSGSQWYRLCCSICHCSRANQLIRHQYLQFPSWRFPHPEMMHFLPTGNFCTVSGRQMGWMYLLKTRGSASSSTATSKSRRIGLKRGCWMTLVTLTLTVLLSVPFSDVVPM